MQSWFELCNLRSTLLHMQLLYCSLSEQIELQESRVTRAHKDRLLQYSLLHQDYLTLQQSNFKKLIILKLESCLATHQADQQMWQLLDEFKSYAGVIERQMLQNMSKVYIGKKVLFDVGEVEKALVVIEGKMTSFLDKYVNEVNKYEDSVKLIGETRKDFQGYLSQIKTLYGEICQGYGGYLKKRLARRSKQLDKTLSQLKKALMI